MAGGIREKHKLDEVTHSVRASQAVLQYGVGAMIDFTDQTLVTAAPEFWSRSVKIFDDRFAHALDVDYFAMPVDIAYARFPEWYFCPKCRRFQPLEKWISEYREKYKKQKPAWFMKDENMVTHMQCTKCGQDLVVSRIVTVCERGHLNDFPWIKWVHTKSKKPICVSPLLKFKTGASGTEGLEGLSVSCSCGAIATLSGAFDKDCFEKLDNEDDINDFRCEGNHPYKHIKEPCGCYPRTVQRGASSVYFPMVYSSLVIPPYADKINVKIEKSNAYNDCVTIIDDEETEEERIKKIKKRLPIWVDKIAVEIGVPKENVEKILTGKWLKSNMPEKDVSSIQYRIAEYAALTGEVISSYGDSLGDFSREEMKVGDYSIPHIKSISLIEKVRVVNALIGFSRIAPAISKDDARFVNIKNTNARWYPAYEVRGEGIFIEFEQSDINKWIADNPQVVERTNRLNESYRVSFIGCHNPRNITPKFIMLHTLSHLLISQLSFECGYSVASLSERIYCAEEADGQAMAGVFIYTASGDSEGTLGGLVRQGRPDVFPQLFKKAIINSKTCSNDPVCITSKGQGRDSLNLAACHACALLPETCCEEKNVFLDRGMIVGTYEDERIGFWQDVP